jgi:pimeloyl-ACP methyl ester carboxylesterase
MGSLLRTPQAYGYRDIAFSTKYQRRARIYFPARRVRRRTPPDRAEILVGDYSLIVFVHGNRASSPEMCPVDLSTDYTRWGGVLHLLARCGFVVVVPDVHETIGVSDEGSAVTETAALVTEVMHWMYEAWEHRDMLLNVLGTPSYPMGLAGHSWGGALVCSRLAGDRHFGPRAIATISGTWTIERSKRELVEAGIPVLFVSGTNEISLFADPSFQPYPESGIPKHQMALQKGQHWDWFPPGEDIFPCRGGQEGRCMEGWRAASELCLTFFTKYLYNQWFLQPYLLTSPQGDRPDVLALFRPGTGCAMKIRWSTDGRDTGSSFGATDEVTLGDWTEGSPW